MEISFVFQGTLTAKKNHKLSVKASYEAILNWIEDENTIVKKGDDDVYYNDNTNPAQIIVCEYHQTFSS